MKKFNIVLLSILILGISFAPGVIQPVLAQVAPVTVLEDNPQRLNNDDANKVLVPDLSAAGALVNANVAGAAGLAGADDTARNVVRIENVLSPASFGDDALDDNDGEDDNRGRHRRNRGADKILEINGMVANDGFNADVFGVKGSEDAMSIESGKATLDRNMDLKVRVKGLRFLDGTPAEEAKFSAGVACMDSGYVKASGKDSGSGDDFALDENGDGRFEGHVDLEGASCIAPTVMVVNETGQWVAIAGHAAATANGDNQGNDDQDDQGDDQGNDDQANDDQNDDQNDDNLDDNGLDNNGQDDANINQTGDDQVN